MDTLDYILKKFNANSEGRSPIPLPLSRHGGLTTLWAELGYTVGVEIGVEQGRFSKEIFEGNPGVKLYCVDPWKAYRRYRDHVSQSKLDGFYEETKKRLAPYNPEIIRKSSLDAAKQFKANSVDFVFIDGNHDFEYVVNDIIEWAKRVRPGGMVSGHDYRHEGKEKPPLPFHVIQAINAYTDAYKIRPWFIVKKDKCPSWFFIKS